MKHFSLNDPTATEMAKMLESTSTPPVAMFRDLFAKQIQNALGDKTSMGATNANSSRNFKYLRMFYETFNNHDEYVCTFDELKSSSCSVDEVGSEISGCVSGFGAYDASLDQADEDYIERCGFASNSDDNDASDDDRDNRTSSFGSTYI